MRRLYRAMNARDLPAVGALTHPEVEWIPDSRVGEGPVRGRENVVRFFMDRAEIFDQLHAEPEAFREHKDKVLAFVRTTGRGHGSGAAFEIRIGHLWTVQDGVVVRGEGFGDRSEALGAAGMTD